MTRAVRWLLEHAGAALFLDPGLGKTSITLAAISILKKEGLLERALVVAPLRPCYSVWPREAQKWRDFQHLRVAILHGRDKDETLEQDADVFVINPDGLGWLFEHPSRRRLLGADTLVVDESTKFKHTRTTRYKIIKGVLPSFRRRWILTGTPAPNGLMDLFGQVYLVDQGRALGRFITHYRNTYFDATGYGGYTWRLKPGAEEQIYRAIAPYTLRLQAEDYLELPPVVNNTIAVTLPAEARRVYTDLEAEFFAELESGASVAAVSAAVSHAKCAQVANGAVYRTPPERDDPTGDVRWSRLKEYETLHNEKIDALRDLLDERQGKPTLVLYGYGHDRDRLLKEFGTVPVLGGGVSARKGEAIADAWNRGEVSLLLGHPQSMAHGLNMQDCADADCIVWFDIPWDLELYDQAIRRLRRQGATARRIVVHHLVAEGTVDELKLRRLHAKDKSQRALLDALRQYSQSKRRARP